MTAPWRMTPVLLMSGSTERMLRDIGSPGYLRRSRKSQTSEASSLMAFTRSENEVSRLWLATYLRGSLALEFSDHCRFLFRAAWNGNEEGPRCAGWCHLAGAADADEDLAQIGVLDLR